MVGFVKSFSTDVQGANFIGFVGWSYDFELKMVIMVLTQDLYKIGFVIFLMSCYRFVMIIINFIAAGVVIAVWFIVRKEHFIAESVRKFGLIFSTDYYWVLCFSLLIEYYLHCYY